MLWMLWCFWLPAQLWMHRWCFSTEANDLELQWSGDPESESFLSVDGIVIFPFAVIQERKYCPWTMIHPRLESTFYWRWSNITHCLFLAFFAYAAHLVIFLPCVVNKKSRNNQKQLTAYMNAQNVLYYVTTTSDYSGLSLASDRPDHPD